MINTVFLFASINGALAVILGAFGAHGLKGKITPSLLDAYQTGTHYHLFHVLALLCLGLLMMRVASIHDSLPFALKLTAYCWMAGMALFSGSLYGLALGGGSWLGPVTPVGGLLLIIGWMNLAVAIAKGAVNSSL